MVVEKVFMDMVLVRGNGADLDNDEDLADGATLSSISIEFQTS